MKSSSVESTALVTKWKDRTLQGFFYWGKVNDYWRESNDLYQGFRQETGCARRRITFAVRAFIKAALFYAASASRSPSCRVSLRVRWWSIDWHCCAVFEWNINFWRNLWGCTVRDEQQAFAPPPAALIAFRDWNLHKNIHLEASFHLPVLARFRLLFITDSRPRFWSEKRIYVSKFFERTWTDA